MEKLLNYEETKSYLDRIVKIDMNKEFNKRFKHVTYSLTMIGVEFDPILNNDHSDDKLYYSVPKKLIFEDNDITACIDSNEFIKYVKNILLDVLGTSADDPIDSEEFKSCREWMLDEITFYAKVRHDDIWDIEKIMNKLDNIQKEIDKLSEYIEA